MFTAAPCQIYWRFAACKPTQLRGGREAEYVLTSFRDKMFFIIAFRFQRSYSGFSQTWSKRIHNSSTFNIQFWNNQRQYVGPSQREQTSIFSTLNWLLENMNQFYIIFLQDLNILGPKQVSVNLGAWGKMDRKIALWLSMEDTNSLGLHFRPSMNRSVWLSSTETIIKADGFLVGRRD